jgi:hypothetical protein
MKKIFIASCAMVFLSLTTSARQQLPPLTGPFQAVVVGGHLSLPWASPVTEIGRDMHVQRSIQNRKFTIARKMTFRNRLALRIMSKRIKSQSYMPGEDLIQADKMAKNSRTLGIIAVVLAVIPFTIIVAIPLGIIAINKASKAKKMGSTKKTGRVLGIVSLAIVGLWIIIASIIALSGGLFLGGF